MPRDSNINVSHIVSVKALRQFWTRYPQAEQPLRAWYLIANKAQWRTPADSKADYGTASIVGNNRVIFNIKGNDYRLVVLVKYEPGRIYVRFVGTHAEYDRIEPETI